MGIRYVDLSEAMIQRPRVTDWSPSIHHGYQSPFAAKEVDQELEKGIDGESLGSVSDTESRAGICCTS